MTPKETFGGFPLTWPEGVPRTEKWKRKDSRFKATFGKARDELLEELRRLGAETRDRPVVISSMIPLRKDGLPYAGQATPADTGVAVYFWMKKVQRVFACDLYKTVGDNLYAIRLTIEALRGIQRWGSVEMFERAFTGFAALPPPDGAEMPWHEVLGVPSSASLFTARSARNRLAELHHPDRGGDQEAMARVNRAMAEREAIERKEARS